MCVLGQLLNQLWKRFMGSRFSSLRDDKFKFAKTNNFIALWQYFYFLVDVWAIYKSNFSNRSIYAA